MKLANRSRAAYVALVALHVAAPSGVHAFLHAPTAAWISGCWSERRRFRPPTCIGRAERSNTGGSGGNDGMPPGGAAPDKLGQFRESLVESLASFPIPQIGSRDRDGEDRAVDSFEANSEVANEKTAEERKLQHLGRSLVESSASNIANLQRKVSNAFKDDDKPRDTQSDDDDGAGVHSTAELDQVRKALIERTLPRINELTVDDDGTTRFWATPELGQVSKALLQRATDPINELTGKVSYQIGDLSRYLNDYATSRLEQVARMKGSNYDLWDLSRWIDARVKERVNAFTGKDEYKVGDITRTIIRKVAKDEYSLADITLLCRMLVSLGADLTPVAGFLPVRLLLELFDYSIALDLGERFFKTISVELDKRMNEEVVGETRDTYNAGDLTKQAILDYTGKDEYAIGDLSERMAQEDSSSANIIDAGAREKKIDYSLGSPWEEDRGQSSDINMDVLKELEECLAMEKALIEKLNCVRTQTQ